MQQNQDNWANLDVAILGNNRKESSESGEEAGKIVSEEG